MPVSLEYLLVKFDTVIFDCDGVILDSNNFKNKAFEDVLGRKNFSLKNIERFIDYHKRNGGISRYAKFEYFQREILQQSVDPILHEQLLSDFASECRSQYLSADLTEGIISVLEELKKSDKNIFVASGSDEVELQFVFMERKINHYFQGVYGSPRPKIEIVRSILSVHKNCLFIGDSVVDLRIAVELGIDFMALMDYSDNEAGLESEAVKFSFPMIKRFSELIIQ